MAGYTTEGGMASSSTPAGAQSSSDEDSSIMAPIVPARLMTYITADLMIKINFNDSYRLRALLADPLASGMVTTLALSCKTDFSHMRLSEGAMRVLTTPNAGGTSEKSEAISFEVLRTLLRVRLTATEMEIHYFPYGSKKTDYAVTGPDGQVFGVSVTRANNYRRGHLFDTKCARHLLRKKLDGIIWSTANVNSHKWERQILHIIAPDRRIARLLRRQYRKLNKDVRANSIVLVTILSSVPAIW